MKEDERAELEAQGWNFTDGATPSPGSTAGRVSTIAPDGMRFPDLYANLVNWNQVAAWKAAA